MNVTIAPAERERTSRFPLSTGRRLRLGGVRRALARIPRACLACAAIAFVNSAVWGLVIPAFQVPDEPAHFAYTQYLVERGDLPDTKGGSIVEVSPELRRAMREIPFTVETQPSWIAPRPPLPRQLAHLSKRPSTVPDTVATNAPLYYALEAIPYSIGRSTNLFDRLYLMRLLSALLAALTVAFTFLFVREVLPRPPWAATLAGLAVAFQPMFGFVSGGVNNDNLLYTCGAILLYLVARVFRRGLTPRLGIALGAVALAGMLTKTSFAGLLPGAALACLVALWRATPAQRRRGIVAAFLGLAILGIGFGVWLYVNNRSLGRAGSTTAGFNSPAITSQISIRGQLSYLWQVFFPALPGMQHFTSMGANYPLWDWYVKGFIGHFGWWYFGFDDWVNWLGLGVLLTILLLALGGLVRARAAVQRRWVELACYLAIAGGYMVLVEVASYRYQVNARAPFEQARYVLPLLGFYGLLVAVAARALGRRWGPVAAALLVVLALTHSLFGMLLVVGHYYA